MRVDANASVFKSKEYLKDKLKFYVLEQNLPSENLELHSDLENYVVCRGNKNYPTWVWTKDNFPLDKLKELKNTLTLYLLDGKTRFTCKQELYNLLVDYENLNKEDYFKLGCLTCESYKEVNLPDCHLDHLRKEDFELVLDYWYLSNLEMKKDMPSENFKVNKEDLYEEALTWVDNDTFYLLRDSEDNVVCMVKYQLLGDMAKLTHVYTPVKYRSKGYAKSVVNLVTKELLNKGYKVVLYTDYNNPRSNKAYLNAGFKEEEYLVNFTCSKSKVLK